MVRTTKCIVCGGEIYCWGGHFHTNLITLEGEFLLALEENGGKVITGFCEQHTNVDAVGVYDCEGCYGEMPLNTEIENKIYSRSPGLIAAGGVMVGKQT